VCGKVIIVPQGTATTLDNFDGDLVNSASGGNGVGNLAAGSVLEASGDGGDLISGGTTFVGDDPGGTFLYSYLNNTRDLTSTTAALALQAPSTAPAAAFAIADACITVPSRSTETSCSPPCEQLPENIGVLLVCKLFSDFPSGRRAHHTKPNPKSMLVIPLYLWGV